MTMKFTTGERLIIIRLMNAYAKNLTLSDLKLSFKILDRIEIKEEEYKKLGIKVDKATGVIKEVGDQKIEAEIDVNIDMIAYLKNLLEKRDKDKGFELSDSKHIISLADKIMGEQENVKK